MRYVEVKTHNTKNHPPRFFLLQEGSCVWIISRDAKLKPRGFYVFLVTRSENATWKMFNYCAQPKNVYFPEVIQKSMYFGFETTQSCYLSNSKTFLLYIFFVKITPSWITARRKFLKSCRALNCIAGLLHAGVSMQNNWFLTLSLKVFEFEFIKLIFLALEHHMRVIMANKIPQKIQRKEFLKNKKFCFCMIFRGQLRQEIIWSSGDGLRFPFFSVCIDSGWWKNKIHKVSSPFFEFANNFYANNRGLIVA